MFQTIWMKTAPWKVKIDPAAANTRLKIRPTGHGFGGTQNCAEFCPKEHSITVDGTKRFSQIVWKEDCGLNPVYPQGGTWVYNRTNWCPGQDVPTYDFELTPWVRPGDSVTLDYNVAPYTWNNQGSRPYWVIETQLVSYSAPNFTLDASVEQIKSPSRTDIWKRMNPICANPVITIRNTGTTPLTSLKITYGVGGAPQSTYNWTGNLGFLQETDVTLGTFSFAGTGNFQVSISEPNGGADQYAANNSMQSTFTYPPEYPSNVIFELRTNNLGYENSYEIRDAAGNVVHSRANLDNATFYRDTLTLAPGCYEFRLRDEGGDGLDWWANRSQAGTGSMRVRRGDNGSAVQTFNPDFGSEIYQQFTVGYKLSDVADERRNNTHVSIYPNPTSGEINVALDLGRRQDALITVRDLLGRTIHERAAKGVERELITIQLLDPVPGTYIVSVETASGMTSRKVVVR